VNAASLAPVTNSVAPGEFVTLVGSGLSSTTLSAPGLPLATTLGGVQVMVNGRLAPLSYVSPVQLNVILPYATTESFATFQVINNGAPSNKVTVYVAPTAPGVFTTTQNGVGPGAVLHSDFSLVTQANPAKVGDTLQIFVTGLGAVTPAVADGAAAPSSPLSLVNVDVAVYIDTLQAQVTFKGLAPGFAGLYQINCVVPAGVSSGLVYLDVSTADAYTSEAKLYIQ
jgi:adhesin/invasin